ncbi:hypothetical protein caldi_05200 [Caldinitratiruptor microaerophilus]|uniref:Uncharacterized protein n=1 Tax=Caldinitratiruptor microaerophilus TaxID=671077 RepID=A0AA35CI24_9FIRM|nr:hypothetical protein caldi_05200 [Caldinitratiruptor microaerophilus]
MVAFLDGHAILSYFSQSAQRDRLHPLSAFTLLARQELASFVPFRARLPWPQAEPGEVAGSTPQPRDKSQAQAGVIHGRTRTRSAPRLAGPDLPAPGYVPARPGAPLAEAVREVLRPTSRRERPASAEPRNSK